MKNETEVNEVARLRKLLDEQAAEHKYLSEKLDGFRRENEWLARELSLRSAELRTAELRLDVFKALNPKVTA